MAKSKITLSIIAFGLTVLLWNSCSITKRYHNRGFHIEYGFSNKQIETKKVSKTKCFKDTLTLVTTVENEFLVPEYIESNNSQSNLEEKDSFVLINSLFQNSIESKSHLKEGNLRVKTLSTIKKVTKKSKAKSSTSKALFKTSLISFICGLLFLLMGYLISTAPGGGCIGAATGAVFYAIAAIMGGVVIVLLIIAILVLIFSKNNS